MATKKNNKNPAPAQTGKPDEKAVKAPASKPRRRISAAQALTVVGIGASAGGLRALQSFFDGLPSDTGMAFVVVTHMHPEHESHLSELLQPHTEMQVNQVQKTTPVSPNHVYVMPPNRQVLITDSHLDLGDFEGPRGRRSPIDEFFRSLAAAHQESIGVILSGSGTDGSVGVKDIKESGGLLLVQSPDEAEYDGMPRAAISTGLADLILPVHDLAGKLTEYSRHRPSLPQKPEQLTDAQQDTIDRILGQVHARTGNDFGQYKRSTILRRIQRRMQLNDIASLEEYLDFLRTGNAEAIAMFNDILIGVTNFFRDRPSWKALAETVIPALFENKASNAAIRAWSIGCATGEEAYGMAMLLLEHAATLDKHFEIQVFASDLAEVSLAHAREGLYPTAIEADVSPERLERFFTQQGNHYRVKRELRDMVMFTNHNILRDPPFSHIDLIVCRNLLIYLRREVQDNIFEIFHYALNAGGFLFLGNSESADSVPTLFNLMDKTHRIYRARPWKGSQPHLPSLPAFTAVPKGRQQALRLWDQSVRKSVQIIPAPLRNHEACLEESAPPSLIIDDQFNVLHVSETAGRYLVQPRGAPTRELLKLVRPEIQPELHMVLFQAFERDRATMTNAIWVKFNGAAHRVIVSVHPSRSNGPDSDRQALVIFLEDEINESAGTTEVAHEGSTKEHNLVVAQLQGEVDRLREQLQSMLEEYNSSNEEMKATNEELQSINEEYRSTTEELETSREELQSVNEELQTVNNELKGKLDEITRANSDLENLMGASEIATLFLNRDLHIKRFTSGMDQVLDLLPTDQGRPIGHFANKLGYDRLVEDAKSVLHKLSTVERELQSKAGRWYQVRLRPYRTVDHKIDGIVLTFMDITELKAVHAALQEMNETLQARVEERTRESDDANKDLTNANKMFSSLFQSNPIPTALNRLEDWTFLNVNQAYLDYFGVKEEDVIGRSALEFGFAPDPLIRAQMSEELELNSQISHVELDVPSARGQARTVLGSLQRVQVNGEKQVISSFMDITERVQSEKQIRTLASELTLAEQAERHRISRLLHDELQQRLFAIRMHLSFLSQDGPTSSKKEYQENLTNLGNWLSEAIEMTRDLSIELSPLILEGEGLVQAVNWLAAQMKDKFGLQTEMRADGINGKLDPSVRILLYQAIRELLFNIVKHSGTLDALVEMEQTGNRLKIVISDRGVSFDAASVLASPGPPHGLVEIEKKVTMLGCTLEVDSRPGFGSQVTIEAPIDQAEG